jgi:hypothetical protein
MTWARHLKRVFWIDNQTCENCGGAVRVIASIEDPEVIEMILTYLERREAASVTPRPRARRPPRAARNRTTVERVSAGQCRLRAPARWRSTADSH